MASLCSSACLAPCRMQFSLRLPKPSAPDRGNSLLGMPRYFTRRTIRAFIYSSTSLITKWVLSDASTLLLCTRGSAKGLTLRECFMIFLGIPVISVGSHTKTSILFLSIVLSWLLHPYDKTQYLEMSGVRVPFSTFLLDVIKHFCVHISQLVLLGLNRLTMFEIYYRSLNINPSVNLFRAFYKLNKQGHWFSFECRSGKGGHDKIFNEFYMSLKHWKDRFFLIDHWAILDAMPWMHHDSSVADPPPTGVQVEDIHRLCANIIDLHPVHLAMLYEIAATSMSQFLKFPMFGGVRVGKWTALTENEVIVQHTTQPLPSESQIPPFFDYQKVIEHEDERVIPTNKKAQTARDKAIGKNAATEGTFRRSKKRKRRLCPLLCHVMSSSSGGLGRQAFPQRNPGGDGIGSSLRADVGLPIPFVPAWNLTTHSILNDAESWQDMMINLATHVVRDQQNQLSDYQALQRLCRNKLSDNYKVLQLLHLDCVAKEADLTERLAAVKKEKDDLLDRIREREEQIKQLEVDLASKTSSLTEAEGTTNTLKGDLERLTMDSIHIEIVRHNYVRLFPLGGRRALRLGVPRRMLRQSWPLPPTMIQNAKLPLWRFCSSLGYWLLDSSEAACIPGNVRHLAIGAWTHPARLALREMFTTWPLALGLIRHVLRSGKCSLLGHWRLNLSRTSCAPGDVHHLAIGAWTHPERLTLREMFITWPLALRLIRGNEYLPG
ncbi:hypothetical protein Tco_0178158 [Tanacetum coccineum]